MFYWEMLNDTIIKQLLGSIAENSISILDVSTGPNYFKFKNG